MNREQLRLKATTIKMSREQRRLIDQRAKQCGVRASVWMRTILMQAAQSAAKQPIDGWLRIREPNGVSI